MMALKLRGNKLITGPIVKEQNPACWHRVQGREWGQMRLRGLARTRGHRALWATVQ